MDEDDSFHVSSLARRIKLHFDDTPPVSSFGFGAAGQGELLLLP